MNRGEYRHYIEIWEKSTMETTNELGECDTEYIYIKSVFAKIETRVGSLLTGRAADTILSTVTHKITYPYNEYPQIKNDANIIKYRNKIFDVNYALNENFEDIEQQVFVTERY